MNWLIERIFWLLLGCFVSGVLLGMALWALRWRGKERGAYERLRLGRDAESDRLRLRISSLQNEAEQTTELETEVIDLRAQADRLSNVEGELEKATSAAGRVPELEKQIVDLRSQDGSAGGMEMESALLGGQPSPERALEAEVIELRETAGRVEELDKSVASLSVVAGQAEMFEAELRSTRIELEESRSRTGQLDAELTAAQEDVSRLVLLRQESDAALRRVEADLEACRSGLAPNLPAAVEASEPENGTPSWQEGTTDLGTPGADHHDDLKKINGIGPVMERTLNGFGIQTWEQIAAFTTADIEKVSGAIKAFAGRMERDDWIAGAKELLSAGHVPGEDTSGRSLTSNQRKRKLTDDS